MENFEKLGEFKKSVKGLVRGAIRAGVFGDEGKFEFSVTKTDSDDVKVVTVTIVNGPYTLTVGGDACTRVYNKVTPEFFEPIVAQFSKMKKVESMTFDFAD